MTRWPSKVYAATVGLGVYYSEDFGGPTDPMPTWTAVNDGLTDLAIYNFQCDRFHDAYRQYCTTKDTVWRREGGGAWTPILTTAQARALTGKAYGEIAWVYSDSALDGVVWALVDYYYPTPAPHQWVVRSTDYGATWGAGHVVGGEHVYLHTRGSVCAHGQYVWVMKNYGFTECAVYFSDDYGVTFAGVAFATTQTVEPRVKMHPALPTTCWTNALNAGGNIVRVDSGPLAVAAKNHTVSLRAWLGGSTWFDPDDVLHMRQGTAEGILVTDDAWETAQTVALAAGRTIGVFAPTPAGGDPNALLMGCTFLAGGTVLVADGEDAASAVVRDGPMADEAPYTDSIPHIGDALITNDGLWALGQAPSHWQVYSCRFEEVSV
jgi:hypothetical protein